MCHDSSSSIKANEDPVCAKCGVKVYLKQQKYCFKCTPKCSECRIMRVTEEDELCMACLNQRKREQERLSSRFMESSNNSRSSMGLGPRYSNNNQMKIKCPCCSREIEFGQTPGINLMMCKYCKSVVEKSGSKPVNRSINKQLSVALPTNEMSWP